jgi:hypothetical protein
MNIVNLHDMFTQTPGSPSPLDEFLRPRKIHSSVLRNGQGHAESIVPLACVGKLLALPPKREQTPGSHRFGVSLFRVEIQAVRIVANPSQSVR